jgi:hypothetical protein
VRPFESHDLAVLDAEPEVAIETRDGPDGPVRRTVIWVVVDDDDVYVRSVRGDLGRWYQALTAFPEGTVIVAGRSIPVRAEPASDPASIEACTRGLRRKYGHDPSLASMLRSHVLPTTMRLVPR